MTSTRGLRNNNPGNIDFNPRNNWRGQLRHDPNIEKRFCRFDTPLNGIRALGRLLINYRKLHGLRSVEALIARWAPSNENDTRAYARAVAQRMGVSTWQPLTLDQPTLEALVTAIIWQENGQQPYAPELIAAAVKDALA